MKIFFTIVLILFLSSSCIKNMLCIDGNGSPATESREATLINHVVNTTAADVVYRKGDTTSITIFAESNLISHIVTDVNSMGKLEIRTDPRNACFDYRQKPRITITSPLLSGMEVTGSGNFEADSLSGQGVELKLTGSGNLYTRFISTEELIVIHTGSGNAEIGRSECDDTDFTITGSGDLSISGNATGGTTRVTGSGNVEAADLILTTANATITGSGNIYTHVVNSLNAVISGSGNIYLRGNPTVNQSISGSGRVISY